MYNTRTNERLMPHVPALDNGKGSIIVIDDQYKQLIEEHPELLTPKEEVEEKKDVYHVPRLAR